MAIKQDGPEITLPASGNLAAYQFHVVTLATDGEVKLAADPTSGVEAALGILQNKPNAVGEEAVVRVNGIAKAMGGASVNPGIWVTWDSSGHIVAATENDSVVGISREAVVDGEIHEIILSQGSGYTTPTD